MTRLPTGRPGQLLALLLLLLVAALAWTAAAPLLDWYADREAALQSRRTLARRMEALAATLPALRQTASQAASQAAIQARDPDRPSAQAPVPAPVPVLEGASDAVAGAALQQKVQDMAARAGLPLASAELLPAEPAGAYRRIRLRITLRAPWPTLVALLDAVAGPEAVAPPGALPGAPPGTPATTPSGLTVDDLQIHGTAGFIRTQDAALDASWTVLAFRPADPGGPPGTTP